MLVEVGDAAGGVDAEEDEVGLLDGEVDLAVDFGFEDIFAIDDPAAGGRYEGMRFSYQEYFERMTSCLLYTSPSPRD